MPNFNTLLLNTRIKLLTSVLFVVLASQAWFIYQQNKSISEQAAHLSENSIPLLIHAQQMKLAVVQVQQWLTDISATRGRDGLNDGFDEAEANAKLFKTLLSELVEIDSKNADKHLAMLPVFDAYYETGRRMAQIYIDEGPQGGNQIMAEFDAVAEKMTTEIDTFLEAISNQTQIDLQHEVEATQAINTMIIFIVAAILVLVGFTWFMLRGVQKQLGADPTEITRITDAIASGDLNIASDRTHEDAIGVLTSLLKMRDNLREAIDRERQLAAESLRIRQALDVTSGNIMVADADNNIIYLNKAVQDMFTNAEADIKRDIAGFESSALIGANIDQFHKNPAHQQHLLKNLNSRLDSGFEIGGRSMKFVANPVIGKEGERLGTVVEWTDNTAQVAIQNEIEALISAAQRGDLSRSITLGNKEGFFLDISQGINALLSVTKKVFDDIASVMGGMAEGNLRNKMTGDYEGTFADVQTNVNSTIDSLLEIITSIHTSADQITSGSDEISSGNNNLSERTEQQAASLEETASAMEELTSTVRQNADNAQMANQLSDSARTTAGEGTEIVNNAISAMEEINTASSKISEIVSVIDEIAFQTNLLALNASVEAARAGEQGRGFAVVATEVRNLAQRSATSAREIKHLIDDSVEKVETGSELVNKSGEALEKIMTSVVKVGDIVAEISTASNEQAEGIDEINKTITNLDDLTQQNAALAEETSAASISMNEHALNMSREIEFFQISTNGVTRPKQKIVAVAAKPNTRVSDEPAPAPPGNDEWEEF